MSDVLPQLSQCDRSFWSALPSSCHSTPPYSLRSHYYLSGLWASANLGLSLENPRLSAKAQSLLCDPVQPHMPLPQPGLPFWALASRSLWALPACRGFLWKVTGQASPWSGSESRSNNGSGVRLMSTQTWSTLCPGRGRMTVGAWMEAGAADVVAGAGRTIWSAAMGSGAEEGRQLTWWWGCRACF